MQPAADLIVTLNEDGYLGFTIPSKSEQLLFGPVGTAMWVKLCMHQWNISEAAESLASLWGDEAASIYQLMQDWIADLLAMDVLSV